MRTCPNCGHMLSEKDTICFKCGMQLSQIERPSMNNMPPQFGMNMPNRNGQRPMGNPNPNKRGQDKSIYIVAGLIILLAVIALVIVFVGKNNKMSDNGTEKKEEVVLKPDPVPEKPVEPVEPEPEPEIPVKPDPEPEPENPSTGAHEGQIVIKENQHLVTNNGYQYAVPNEYTEKDYGKNGFDILNYQHTKEMIIAVSIGNLSELKKQLPAVKQIYVDSGAVVHDIKITTVAGVQMICVELTKNGQNLIMGITDAASGEIFTIAAWNAKTNDFDYDILAEGAEIVKTAVRVGGAANTNSTA